MLGKYAQALSLACLSILLLAPNQVAWSDTTTASNSKAKNTDSSDKMDVASLTEQKLSALIKAKPNDWKTQYTVGRYYEDKGIDDQSLEAYEKAAKLIIAAPKALNSDPMKCDVFKHMALLYLKEKDPNKAGETVQHAVELYPNNYGVLLAAGYVEQNNTQYRRALALYQRAQKVEPKKSDIYVALADCYMGINDSVNAKASIDKALKVDPRSKVARYEKAKMLMGDNKPKDALPYLAANFKDDPLSHDSDNLYAAALAQTGQNSETLIPLCCLLSSAKGKDLVTIKATVGSIIAKCQGSTAQTAISKAASKIPDLKQRARLHFCLGDVYDKLSQPATAMRHYQSGLDLDPKFARGYLRLGEDVETFKHDNKTALKLYEKAKSLDDKDHETIFRIDALKKAMKRP